MKEPIYVRLFLRRANADAIKNTLQSGVLMDSSVKGGKVKSNLSTIIAFAISLAVFISFLEQVN